MRGAGTRAGPQPSLLTVPASWDLFVLMRETPIIGFSTTAKRRKPSCRAEAPPGGASGRSPIPPRRGAAGPPRPPPSFPPAPQPPQPRLPRLPRQRQPRARHHPRYVRTAGPGRAGPDRGGSSGEFGPGAHSSPAADRGRQRGRPGAEIPGSRGPGLAHSAGPAARLTPQRGPCCCGIPAPFAVLEQLYLFVCSSLVRWTLDFTDITFCYFQATEKLCFHCISGGLKLQNHGETPPSCQEEAKGSLQFKPSKGP